MKYDHQESAVLELRDVPDKIQSILKTVIGFSNMYGGQIIIDIDDNREVFGVPEEWVDGLIDSLTRSIYDAIMPSVFPSIFTKKSH